MNRESGNSPKFWEVIDNGGGFCFALIWEILLAYCDLKRHNVTCG